MAAPINEMLVQPQSIGEHFLSVMPIAGPASYLGGAGNGQIISAQAFGMLSIRFATSEDLDPTETNYVRIVQAGKGGTKTMRVRWYVLATNAEVANAVNLSAITIRYMVIGN